MRLPRTILCLRLLCLVFLCTTSARASGDTLASARDQYAAQNYEEALDLLTRTVPKPRGVPATRLLGLTYYHMLKYQEALPLLQEALPAYPADGELHHALADVLLALGQPQTALGQVEKAQNLAPQSASNYALAGRILLALGREGEARAAWERAIALDPVASAPLAMELTRYYARQGKTDLARELAQRTVDAAPETFEADELRLALQQLQTAPRSLAVHLGYRVEYDSNVVLEPDDTVAVLPGDKGKSDVRNVFFADLLGRYNVAPHWDLFGEAHLYQSVYDKLDDYAQFRQNYVLSLGWSDPGYGFRMPYEFTNVLLDGVNYLTAHTVSPGAYVRLGEVTLHGFFRYEDNDFDEDVRLQESRSGKSTGGGALLLWPFHSGRGSVRLLFDGAHVDAEGVNWERDEYSLLAEAGYRWLPEFNTRLGVQFIRQRYDDVHDVFLVRRRDDGTELFLSADYRFYENWELNFNAAWVDWDSNIDIYQYPRSVVAVGLSVHF